MNSSPITTHVLDTTLGRPAAGVPVELLAQGVVVAQGVTDASGRVMDLAKEDLQPGIYQLRFDTAAYARAGSRDCFYPEILITFTLSSSDEHFHLPLILSSYGYTTYRGSR